jgi:hypothetical protein
MLFEFNDEFTRASFRNRVVPYLRDIMGRRGILDFQVICDETNNTDEVIQNEQFVGDIYIKPARAIRGIQLNFIAVRGSVDFTKSLVSSNKYGYRRTQMAFNVQDFKSRGLQFHGARPTLFQVEINNPPAGIASNGAIEKLKLLCNATQLHQIVDKIPVGYMGREIKVSGDRTVPDWNISVINDEDFAVFVRCLRTGHSFRTRWWVTSVAIAATRPMVLSPNTAKRATSFVSTDGGCIPNDGRTDRSSLGC